MRSIPTASGANAAPFLVPFTRQQMADMTGQRIETTVVRVLRVLETGGRLTRDGRAVMWHPRSGPS